jgi:hypothetical protein
MHAIYFQMKHDEEGNAALTILEVSPEHKGVYTVKAHNSCGEAKCFASLIVKTISSPEIKRKSVEVQEKPIAPAFQELFADRAVNENETARFECVITGKPTPKVGTIRKVLFHLYNFVHVKRCKDEGFVRGMLAFSHVAVCVFLNMSFLFHS